MRAYLLGTNALGFGFIALGARVWASGNPGGGAVLVFAIGVPTIGVGWLAWWVDRFLDRNTPR